MVFFSFRLSLSLYAFLVAAILLAYGEARGCTGFALRTDEGLVFARNTDLCFSPGVLTLNEARVSREAFVRASGRPLKWASRYRSLTINQVAEGWPNEGMNETGLVVAMFSLFPDRPYPRRRGASYLSEFDWVQYHLDSSANVEEVVESTQKLNLSRVIAMNALHFLVCDKNRCLIVEGRPEGYRYHDLSKLPAVTTRGYLASRRHYRSTLRGDSIPAVPSYHRFAMAAAAAQKRGAWPEGEVRKFAREQLRALEQVVNGVQYTQFQTLYETGSATLRIKRPGGSFELVLSVAEATHSLTLPTSLEEAEAAPSHRLYYCNEFLESIGLKQTLVRQIRNHITR